MTDNIDEKIQQFIKEVGNRHLNNEQRKIFNTFTRTKGTSVELKVNDSKNNPITIKIDPSKTAEGPQHVMKKHYQGNIGRVTATEILNMLDIVRKGTIHTPSDNHILYSLKRRVNGVTYDFCIKITKKNKIFKSFYSNR